MMDVVNKSLKGVLYHWNKLYFDKEKASKKYDGEDIGLGYCIEGYKTSEPKLGSYWRTSWVVRQDSDGMVETRNSFYQVIGEEGESRNMGL